MGVLSRIRPHVLNRFGAETVEIPSWLRSSLVGYWSGGHRDGVYYPITQLVENGNFANGTMGWTTNLTATIANGAATFTADGISNIILRRPTLWTADAKSGNKVCLAYTVVSNTLASGSLRANGIGSADFSDLVLLPSTVGRQVQIITVLNGAGGDNQITLWVASAVASGSIAITNVMLFDLTAFFGTGNEPTATELDAILADDGTAYWDGTRNVKVNPDSKYFWYDYSGNGRHMKMANLAYTAGSNLDGNGFDVDGVDDYGSIADSAATRLTTGGTLWAWIKPKSIGESSVGVIFDKSTDTSATNGYVFRLSSGNKMVLAVNGGSVGATAIEVISLSKWNFAVATFNSTGRYVYVNGVEVGFDGKTETALPPNVAGTIYIGNRANATDRTFDGTIGLAGIANRALTASEIKYLFDSTRRRYGV